MVVNSKPVRYRQNFTVWSRLGKEPEMFCLNFEPVHNKSFLYCSNASIGLAEFAPIITIESHDNLIIKSDFNTTQQSSFTTRLYSPTFAVSFSAWTYPQLEIDGFLSGIHNTF